MSESPEVESQDLVIDRHDFVLEPFSLEEHSDGHRIPENTQRGHKGKQPATTQSSLSSVFGQWWAEAAACLLMLGMLFAIVGVLLPYQRKPLPNWPFRLSINTVVSVFATLLKTAVLFILSQGLSQLKWHWFAKRRALTDLSWFDAASRGPWGCLKLLLIPRGLHLIASAGATLVVLSLALDPFTQQLIRYYDCRHSNSTLQATLPRSMIYAEAGAHTSAGIFPPATPMLAYINQGLYNPVDVRTPFSCPTGNCTFDKQFSTLGFCATCEDATSEIKISNVTLNEDGWTINTTLPSGTHTSFQGVGSDIESWFTMNASGRWIEMVQAATQLSNDDSSSLTDHYMANRFGGGGCQTEYENSTWSCQGFGGSGAARCRLDPCIRTYEASVDHGQLNETLIEVNTGMFVADGPSGPLWLMADLDCAGADVRSRLQQAGFNITDQTHLIPWNIGIETRNGTASLFVPESYPYISNVTVPGPLLNKTGLPLDIVAADCIYQMYYYPYYSITSFVSDYLSGELTPSINTEGLYGPPQLRAFFNDSYINFVSVNNTFHGMAEAITLRIREYGMPSALPAAKDAMGVVLQEVTCADIRWGYIAFPAALVGLTMLFLVALVGQTVTSTTDKSSVGDWKSSPLPTVFGKLDVEFREEYDQHERLITGPVKSSSLDEMERIALRSRARLNLVG